MIESFFHAELFKFMIQDAGKSILPFVYTYLMRVVTYEKFEYGLHQD